MDEILFQYNPWWESADYLSPSLKPRNERVNQIARAHANRPLVFLTGIRRVGKSSLMRLLANRLMENGVEAHRICYVSVDDYQLRDKNIMDIVSEYRKIHKLGRNRNITLLLDEITYKPDFQIQLKTLIDREPVAIVASSSSSSLLNDARGRLTGRSTTIEVQPLSLEEYLQFKDIEVARRDSHLLDSYFKDYVSVGGLPENVLKPERNYLMNLIDDIIQKDIAAFRGVRDHQVLRDYFTLLMERSGKQVSINKVANILGLSPDTSRRYLGFFEDTYLVQLVSRWGKTNERILSPKKVYACDLGMKHLFIGNRDWGSYFENYVYHRIRKYQQISYIRVDSIELDFFTEDKTLIEAKYNADIEGKQAALYDSFEAKRKRVIRSVKEVETIDAMW